MMAFTRAIFLGIGVSLLVAGCSGTDAATKSSERGIPPTAGESGRTGNSGTTGVGGTGGSSNTGGAPINPANGGGGSTAPGTSVGTADAGANTADKYAAVGTNPFVVVAHDPLSTFGADVDTASYDLFRRDVNLGGLPQRASVRLEEYVNSFPYDYPAPGDDEPHPFRITLAAAPHLLSRGSGLLRVGIQATKPPPFQKKPANLVFLVDTSGSMMSPDKLPLVQYTLTQTLDVLDATDVVSIVSYAGDVAVRLAPTPVSSRLEIERAIAGLTSGGSTNGAGGIQLAYQQAQQAFIQEGINHVVLCTDGDFNVGVSSTKGLVDLITEKRKTGITLTVLGYGVGNLNDAMMEAVSNKGNGIYGVISSQDHATRYVHERMLSTIEHVAKDMKIQVEFNPDLVYAYRLLGYENRAIADRDFRNDVIDAGEVGKGHRVTALYEFVATGRSLPVPKSSDLPPLDGAPYTGPREVASTDFVMVKVRYKAPDAVETDPAAEVAASMNPEAVIPDLSAGDLDLQWAIAIAGFAEILKASPYGDTGHLEIIRQIANAQSHRDRDRAEFLDLLTKAWPRLPQ
jgi:Ca-activated chloride channel family protein